MSNHDEIQAAYRETYAEQGIPRTFWDRSFRKEFPDLAYLVGGANQAYRQKAPWAIAFVGGKRAYAATYLFGKLLAHHSLDLAMTLSHDVEDRCADGTYRSEYGYADAIVVVDLAKGSWLEKNVLKRVQASLRWSSSRGQGIVVHAEARLDETVFGPGLSEVLDGLVEVEVA